MKFVYNFFGELTVPEEVLMRLRRGRAPTTEDGVDGRRPVYSFFQRERFPMESPRVYKCLWVDIQFVEFLENRVRGVRPNFGEVNLLFEVAYSVGGDKKWLLWPVRFEPSGNCISVSCWPVPFIIGLLYFVSFGLMVMYSTSGMFGPVFLRKEEPMSRFGSSCHNSRFYIREVPTTFTFGQLYKSS